MVAQGTPARDDTADGSDPARRYVEALTGLPGVEHVVVVDVSGRHVLGEWGGPPGSADALLERAGTAADPSRTGRRELGDVVSTTASAFHLSRLVLAGPGHPQSVWVGLRVDRAQGSLPWSRAALAGLDGPTGAPAPSPRLPAPRESDDGPGASGEVGGPVVAVPPPPVPVVTRVVTPTPAPTLVPAAPRPSSVHVTLTARVAAPSPAVAPAPVPTASTAVGPVIAEVATTVELGLRPTAPPTPPAPAPPAPAPEPVRRSSFAPVMVVLPPPSPVPDDGTTEEPAPMPAPIIIAPDPAVAVEEAVAPAPDAPAADPTDPDGPRVMRRLIHGLRRHP